MCTSLQTRYHPPQVHLPRRLEILSTGVIFIINGGDILQGGGGVYCWGGWCLCGVLSCVVLYGIAFHVSCHVGTPPDPHLVRAPAVLPVLFVFDFIHRISDFFSEVVLVSSYSILLL